MNTEEEYSDDLCAAMTFENQFQDRWGQLIYMSFDLQTKWNGTYSNQPADKGAYFYTVDFKGGTRAGQYSKKGDIILIR